MDGSSNQHGNGAGLILISLEHTEISFALRFGFKASNNELEYEASLPLSLGSRPPIMN